MWEISFGNAFLTSQVSGGFLGDGDFPASAAISARNSKRNQPDYQEGLRRVVCNWFSSVLSNEISGFVFFCYVVKLHSVHVK